MIVGFIFLLGILVLIAVDRSETLVWVWTVAFAFAYAPGFTLAVLGPVAALWLIWRIYERFSDARLQKRLNAMLEANRARHAR